MEQKTPKSNEEIKQDELQQHRPWNKNKFNKMLDDHKDNNAESRAIKQSNSTK